MSRMFNGSRIILVDKDTKQEIGIINTECYFHGNYYSPGQWYAKLPAKGYPGKTESHLIKYNKANGEGIVELDWERGQIALGELFA